MSEYYIIDFGVNYANEKRYPPETLDSLMQDAWTDGIEKVVCISNSMKESKLITELAKKYEHMHYTLGVHPHNAKQFSHKDLEFIESHKSDKKFFAIGECGLDYSRMFSPKENQIIAFESQIKLAKQLNKKMYLHCRDENQKFNAYDDFIQLLHKYSYYNGIVHCFTGTVTQALELTKLNFKLGITGWILDSRRNKDLLEAIAHPEITIDMLLIETDAPFMPIYPKKESTSSDLWIILEQIAKIKKLEVNFVGEQIYKNSIKFLTE
jgi:TatD DNase family protein